MTTLVTGATGLVGNNVVRLLLERGERVRALARRTSDPRPLEGLDLQVVEGDVIDPAAVERACQGVEKVIHSAAVVHVGWTGRELQQEVNVEGTRHVAQSARHNGLRMVHVSSCDALGPGTIEQPADEDSPPQGLVPCPYVLTKRAAEQALLEEVARGLDAVIVNPAYMLGPWDWKPSSGRMLLAVARQRPWIAPPGGNDFCDVRDVAAGILAALQRGQRARRYILSGTPMSYYDAWRLFAEVCGRKGPIRIGRRPLLRSIGRLGDLWTRVRGREGDINSAAIGMALLPHHYSSARAKAELDYRPRSPREAAEEAWQWFRAHGYA